MDIHAGRQKVLPLLASFFSAATMGARSALMLFVVESKE
jgi:hypothetical protein